MSVSSRTIKTSHADIAISETSGEGFPVLLIHGNSACKEVFRNQLQGEIGGKYRMIAMDLPGHGASSDAFEPQRTYTMPGYADATCELIAELGIDRVVVLGWSLGGHVALEMLPRCPGLAGLMIVGTPPVGIGPEAVMAGFNPSPYAALPGKADLTLEEIEILVRAVYGEPVDPAMRQAMVRTDGRARAVMFAGLFGGEVSDQRALAEQSSVPIAIVNGAEDPLVNLDYVSGLSYGSLWEEHCFVLRGAAHAPFLQVAGAFNGTLERFLDSVAKRGARPSGVGGASKTAAA